MRHPEKIKRTHIDRETGKVVTYFRYRVRLPRPGGGMNCHLFHTRAEANAFAAEQETARRSGLVVNTKVRFDAELISEFCRSHCTELQIGSQRDYKKSLNRVLPYLDGTPLRQITPKALEEFRDKELIAIRERLRGVTEEAIARTERRLKTLRARHMDTGKAEGKLLELQHRLQAVERAGTRAVNGSLGAMRTFLKWATSRGYTGQNVAQFVRKLKTLKLSTAPMEETVLGPAELKQLIEATAPEWRVAMMFLAYGGLRIGETLGVTWGDIELDKARVLVRRQLAGDTGQLRETKTQSGVRFVPLRPSMVTELRRWKLACPKGPMDLVNPGVNGQPMDHHNFRSRAFRPALRRAGLRRVRVHDLRHSAASIWLSAGVPIPEVSKALGHASPLITMHTYAHMIRRMEGSTLADKAESFLLAEETPGKNGSEMVPAPSLKSRKRV